MFIPGIYSILSEMKKTDEIWRVIFEGLLREVNVKIMALWDVMPCSWKLSTKLHDATC